MRLQKKDDVQVQPEEAQAGVAPAPVTVSVDTTGEKRVVTITLPKMKHYTDAEITAEETAKGKEALAVCDLTGELIFKDKNVNEIHNPERPEFDGKVVSTVVLKAIFDALVKV